MMQYEVSVGIGGHAAPPCCGSISTSFIRPWSPPPQLWEQRLQLPQSPRAQSTEAKTIKRQIADTNLDKDLDCKPRVQSPPGDKACRYGELPDELWTSSSWCRFHRFPCKGSNPSTSSHNQLQELLFQRYLYIFDISHPGKDQCCKVYSPQDEGISSHFYPSPVFHCHKLQCTHPMMIHTNLFNKVSWNLLWSLHNKLPDNVITAK